MSEEVEENPEDPSLIGTLTELSDEWLELRSRLKLQSEKKKAVDVQQKPKAKEQTALKVQCKELESEIINHMRANGIGNCQLASKRGTLVVSTTKRRKAVTKENWHGGIEQFLHDNELPFCVEDVLCHVRDQQEIEEKAELKLI